MSHKDKNAFLESVQGTCHDVSFGNAVSINGVRYEDVMLLDGLPCIFVPQSRMKTAVSVREGGGDGGGIVPGEGARTSPSWRSTAKRP